MKNITKFFVSLDLSEKKVISFFNEQDLHQHKIRVKCAKITKSETIKTPSDRINFRKNTLIESKFCFIARFWEKILYTQKVKFA